MRWLRKLLQFQVFTILFQDNNKEIDRILLQFE